LADINQDLLLAALAVLTDAVPRNVLRSTLLTWAQHPDRSVAELLREQGAIEESRVQALQCLVSAHLRNHNGDVQLSLDAWNAQALTQDMLTELENAAPGTTLGATLAATLSPTQAGPGVDGLGSKARSELPSFTQDERFELIKPHAKGGIGQVWLARDRELQREVAVKEIQARYVDREGLRARFLLEAEITGNLEHPGIVPVYSLGRNASGRPFYAMRFIRGETLSTAIKKFHEARTENTEKAGRRSRSTWGIEFQQLLRRFLDVCDAMEYAHSRGVIHRDLKPGNIMLGEYGETLVVDWGLAKRIGKIDIVAVQGESGEGMDFEQGASVGGETQPGTTIGTPSYMSPEQACGSLEELGPASDVYSLGATLYELLTGTFPFAAENTAKIIAKVKAGELTPPRVLVPTVPPQLEAICLKAMAFPPAQRYQSARELALDLEHWMADEPVAAYPERSLQKLSRWLRRHRSWTYAAAAALVGITMVATIAVFVVDNSRKEAEANFQMARQAVDNYLTNVSENTLFKEQDTLDIRNLRKELLESALPFYKKFVKEHSQDAGLREDLANGYFRLGEITRVIGTSRDAFDYYRSALEIWEPLARSAPDNLEFQSRLADCYFVFGQLKQTENLPESLTYLNKALAIYQKLATQSPAEPRFQASLAACCSEMGLCLSLDKRLDDSLKYLNQARTIQQRLVDSHPEKIDYKKSLAEIINRAGYVDYTRRDYPAALRIYQEVQKLCQEILDEVQVGPKPLKIRDLLATSYYNIASMYREQDDARRSLEASKKAQENWSELAGSHPSVTSYQMNLGSAYWSMAWAQYRLGHHSDAHVSVDLELAIFDRLSKAEPNNHIELDYEIEKASALNLKGTIYDDERQNALARATFEEVVQLRRSILERSKGIDDRIVELCMGLENLGETYVDGGDFSEGLDLYRKALDRRQQLNAAHPADRGYAMDVVDKWIAIGNIQRQAGESQNAGQSYDHARDIIRPLLEAKAEDSQLQGQHARVLERKAGVLADQGRIEEALGLLSQAVELAWASLKTAEDGITPRACLSEALWNRARLLRECGLQKEASQLDDELITLWKEPPVSELVDLAARLAVRADVIGYGATPLPRAGQKVRELDRDQAAATLRLALGRGFKDFGRLKADLDLAPLLDRKDLKPLLKGQPLPAKP